MNPGNDIICLIKEEDKFFADSGGSTVGAYVSGWYGFEVESKQHLMDLYIEPSFDPAVCVQFHEMADGRYKAFYNFQPTSKEIVNAVKAYAHEQRIDPTTKAITVCEQAEIAGVFKPLAPVSDYYLDEEERLFVQRLYIKELPFTDDHPIGLDGHSYTLRIYKEGKEKCYRSWCVTPHNWSALSDLVMTVVNRLELDVDRYGEYHRKPIGQTIDLEIPPFLRKD